MELIYQGSVSLTDIMALSTSPRIAPAYGNEMKQLVNSGSDRLGDASEDHSRQVVEKTTHGHLNDKKPVIVVNA